MTSSLSSFPYRQRVAAGVVTLLFATALTACGGSSGGGGSSTTYSGKTDPAVIDGNNADDLAEAATQASIAAIDQDNADSPLGVSLSSRQLILSDELRQRLDGIHQQVIDRVAALPDTASAANINVPGDCGGAAAFSPTAAGAVIKYKDFCVDGDEDGNIIFNGVVTVSDTESSSTIRYENFTVRNTLTDEVQRIDNMTVVCQETVGVYSCTIKSDFVGTNGMTYRIENVQVSGDDANFGVEARVYDRTHGYVEIEATGLVRDCADGSFSAGEIIVSSSASDLGVRVVFSGCGMVNVTTFAVL